MSDRVDVLVVGAGLSGIGAAYRLQTECPGKSYLILEGRDVSGGTWDLFRYPGVRSDSDMFTLGYPFRPWRQPKAIASGETILRYVRDTADRYGITAKIRFGRRVVSAHWSTEDASWTVRTANGEEYSCSFLYLCTGYYRYSGGYDADFPGREEFAGRIVHPQQWPDDLDHAGKRIVVIGSGATAVTLVPALAETAGHVTMVQRSPSYMITLSGGEAGGREMSPAAARLIRSRNVVATSLLYQASRRWPDKVAGYLRRQVAQQLPADVPLDPHFTPRYHPWDQRLCVVPDGDLFAALRAGRASVVTGVIDSFIPKGVRLTDGTEIEADIIVTATGLSMVALGEIAVEVDGQSIETGKLNVYKGMMFSGVPNLAWCVGYINASWTLRADLTSRYVCRLLNYIDRHHIEITTPTPPPGRPKADEPLMALSSGYVRRAAAILPRQGARRPWKMVNNYLIDMPAMLLGRINDGHVRFARRKVTV
ncbi:flavin-containing monooxygenase [Actinoplanes sp. NPDC051513]|uniref:flavin-containing monooxygenase n=1 Tax=Actinoplanes sp. NPDC051513 TaxID=3363908 RepID=UPI0037B65DC4